MPEPTKEYLVPFHRIEKRPCFKCKVVKPITEYPKNNRKYQIPKYKGVSIVCRDCLIAFAEEDYKAVYINEETDKFEMKVFNSREEILEFYESR